MPLCRTAAAALVLALAASPALAAAPPLPTMDEITALVDASRSKDALAEISRVLALRGAAAAPYDRPTLLLLKADCQLQIHDRSGAIATLNLARKEAATPAAAVEPTALVELIQKSPNNTYTPKTPGIAPINILDRSKRKDAFKALETDELVLLDKQVKAASNVTSLPPLVAVARNAAPIRALELAATGATTQVDAVTAQLAAIAERLMNKALGELTLKVESIATKANEQIAMTVPVNVGSGQTIAAQQMQPRGLDQNDIQQLKNVQKTCDEFPPAVKELEVAFGDDQGLGAVADKAQQVKARADTVLNANYQGNAIVAPILPR